MYKPFHSVILKPVELAVLLRSRSHCLSSTHRAAMPLQVGSKCQCHGIQQYCGISRCPHSEPRTMRNAQPGEPWWWNRQYIMSIFGHDISHFFSSGKSVGDLQTPKFVYGSFWWRKWLEVPALLSFNLVNLEAERNEYWGFDLCHFEYCLSFSLFCAFSRQCLRCRG